MMPGARRAPQRADQSRWLSQDRLGAGWGPGAGGGAWLARLRRGATTGGWTAGGWATGARAAGARVAGARATGARTTGAGFGSVVSTRRGAAGHGSTRSHSGARRTVSLSSQIRKPVHIACRRKSDSGTAAAMATGTQVGTAAKW